MEECIICFEERTNYVTFPCHHKVCAVCYPKLTRCPLCNRSLVQDVQIIIPSYSTPSYSAPSYPMPSTNQKMLHMLCCSVLLLL